MRGHWQRQADALRAALNSSATDIARVAPSLPTPAADSVLGTVELLELILRKLEPFDQVTSHQVCKTWQILVETSIHISSSAFPWNEPDHFVEYLLWEEVHDVEKRAPDRKNCLYQARLADGPSVGQSASAASTPPFRLRKIARLRRALVSASISTRLDLGRARSGGVSKSLSHQ